MPGRVPAAAARNAAYFPGPQCRPHRQPGPCLLLSSQLCLYQVKSWHLPRHYPVQTEWQWGWWCWGCLAMAARYMGIGWNFHNIGVTYHLCSSHLCYVSMLNHTFAVIDHTFSLLSHTFFPLYSQKKCYVCDPRTGKIGMSHVIQHLWTVIYPKNWYVTRYIYDPRTGNPS